PAVGRDHAAVRLGGRVHDREDRLVLVVTTRPEGRSRRAHRQEYCCPRRPLMAARKGESMRRSWRQLAIVGLVSVPLAVVAGCGSSSSSSSSNAAGASGTVAAPDIDAAAFTADFSEMKKLTDLAKSGKGLIGVLLPDTTTSARYVQY